MFRNLSFPVPMLVAFIFILIPVTGPRASLARTADIPSSTHGRSLNSIDCPAFPGPSQFVSQIDNPYLPLEPGTTFHYAGTEDGESQTNIVEVTNEAKVIMGVTNIVVRDTVRDADGELIEQTLDWYAQDTAGNVWYFGEDSKDYENGKVVSTEGSWEAGVNGARPGIIMKAHPAVGDAYSQECAPGVAEDSAEVLRLSQTLSIPFGDFEDVIVTKEWTPLDPGVEEEKYYAPCLGMVKAAATKGGDMQSLLTGVTKTSDGTAPRGDCPANSAQLQGLGTTLGWANPTGTAQVHLKITPLNDDGPDINLILGSPAMRYRAPAPVFGAGPYVILPGATYNWRVRATTSSNPQISPTDPSWGMWSDSRSFTTRKPDAQTIQLLSPIDGQNTSDSTPTLRWGNTAKDEFYYEVQLSRDSDFDTDPSTATTAVYWNLAHGGKSTPANSWTVPDASALTPGTYYWRVRQRLQATAAGRVEPGIEWSPSQRFEVR